MRPRRLLKYRIDRTSSYLNSIKNNALRLFESNTEVSHGLHLEFDNEVESYSCQPFSMEYEKPDGTIGVYTPDNLALTRGGFFGFEVKNSDYCNKDSVREQYDCIKRFMLDKHQLRFDVVFSDEFAPGHTFKNLSMLYKYRQLSKSHLHGFGLKKRMGKVFQFGELRDSLRMKKLPQTIAFGLVAHKFANFNFTEKLTNDSILEVA